MQDGQIRRLQVEADAGAYEVIIGDGVLHRVDEWLDAIIERKATLLLVYDEALAEFLYHQVALDALRSRYLVVAAFALPSGEHSKSLEMAGRLYQSAIQAGLDRHAVILALGGGVTGDLAGFVAATYMRGVRFIQLPTTLLAHDSSIGGKVAVNLPEGKNLVGAFHAPKLVLYDVRLLRSLPDREFASGLAEAIKHGVIADPDLFAFLEASADGLFARDPDLLTELLYRSCQVKANVVSQDEREQGLRAILNFGHTVGHAIEAMEYGAYTHGEAVAIGMMAETRIAQAMGLATPDVAERLGALLRRCRLPVDLPDADQNPHLRDWLVEQMRRDKKAELRSLAFILPTAIGTVQIVKDVPEDVVKGAFFA